MISPATLRMGDSTGSLNFLEKVKAFPCQKTTAPQANFPGSGMIAAVYIGNRAGRPPCRRKVLCRGGALCPGPLPLFFGGLPEPSRRLRKILPPPGWGSPYRWPRENPSTWARHCSQVGNTPGLPPGANCVILFGHKFLISGRSRIFAQFLNSFIIADFSGISTPDFPTVCSANLRLRQGKQFPLSARREMHRPTARGV